MSRDLFPSTTKMSLPPGVEALRSLSFSERVWMCRERATGRLLVVKRFPADAKSRGQREAMALHSLEEFCASPNLYSAFENGSGFYIARQFLGGHSLETARDLLSFEQRQSVGNLLASKLRLLHQKYRMVHGDLSPRNILVESSGPGPALKVKFLDWEFSADLGQENLETYQAFRGTLGFAGAAEEDLEARDEKALEACLEFLGVGLSLPAEKRGLFRGLSLWT